MAAMALAPFMCTHMYMYTPPLTHSLIPGVQQFSEWSRGILLVNERCSLWVLGQLTQDTCCDSSDVFIVGVQKLCVCVCVWQCLCMSVQCTCHMCVTLGRASNVYSAGGIKYMYIHAHSTGDTTCTLYMYRLYIFTMV